MRLWYLLLGLACANVGAQSVTPDRLVQAAEEPRNWLTYSGRYSGWRYSALDQINASNASHLAMQWAFQVADIGQFETSLLAVDGILYGTGQNNRAFAIDGHSGRAIWRYQRVLPGKMNLCCGAVNRGFAILDRRLYMATLDAHLIALDARTGNVVFDVQVADYKKGYTMTLAPLALKNEIIVGSAGGEYGASGFIDAFDAITGKRLWRFDTVPGLGQPGHESWAGNSWRNGGAPAWLTGSYDARLNLLYWPTGNPSPVFFGGDRSGDDLYSNSMLALDADTGRLKWHFQFTPHDVHDYDATEIPVLLDTEWQGEQRKLLIQANRNGYLYVLDRETGKFLFAQAFGKTTWAKGIDSDGRPILDPSAEPSLQGKVTCPGALGMTNWFSPSYSPQTRLLYVATSTECDLFTGAPQKFRRGHDFGGSQSVSADPSLVPSGALTALDPLTGIRQWEFKFFSNPNGGALSTAGGIVLVGDSTGNFIALDARSGQDLWHSQLGAGIYSTAITYKIGEIQYIAVPAGSAIFAFALPGA